MNSFYINPYDKRYLDLLENVLYYNNEKVPSRTGINVFRSLLPEKLSFCCTGSDSDTLGFPLITSKKIHWKSVVHELLWMISGDTNVKYLNDNGVTIWNEWADENGDLGPIYGKQLRKSDRKPYMGNEYHGLIYTSRDPLLDTIENIKKEPFSRRHVITLWNHSELEDMSLPPCHGTVIQFFVKQFPENNILDMYMYQRSADIFLGVPFNIASYSLFLLMVSQVTDNIAGTFHYQIGDLHLYENHVDQAKEQLTRKYSTFKPPKVELNKKIRNITDFKYEDIQLIDYKSQPAIKAEVAV